MTHNLPSGGRAPARLSDNVTGRDRYIIGQALAHAVAVIQSMPKQKRERRRELSNMREDMLELFSAYDPETRVLIVYDVLKNTGIDIKPTIASFTDSLPRGFWPAKRPRRSKEN